MNKYENFANTTMVLKRYPQNYEGFIELSKPHKSFF